MENNITQEVLKRVDTVGGKIETVIKVLAEKIGVGADHFWPIFVRQQFIDGLTTAILWTITFIASLIITFIFLKLHKSRKNQEDLYHYDGEWKAASVVVGSISVLLMIFMLIELSAAIPQILNPEYYAFKEIMDMVK